MMGNGGFNGLGGGNGAGFLANQLNNDAGRELLSQAIAGVGGSVDKLATMLNCDINSVQGAISAVMTSVQGVSNSIGLSTGQVINAIERGDASLASQFAQCCCEQKLLATQQGYESRIAIADQTNTLSRQADYNTRSITDAISAQTNLISQEFCALKERELQNKIDSLTAANTTLRGQIDNSAQTATFAAMLAPIQKEVSEIRAAQPNTVSVPWPQLTAVNTTPSIYGLGLGYGLGWGYGSNNGSIWA